MKRLLGLAVCLLACALPALAGDHCLAGSGVSAYALNESFTMQISIGYGEHAGQCHAAITGPSGVVFETYAYDIQTHEYSGKDINNDGLPDVVLYGHIAAKDPWTYWIVSLAEPAGLARQITTVYPLSFEDRDGDGKIEIWTREWAFDGIDGLSTDDSPHPQVAFRLVGPRLSYVSNLFPHEYDAEIIQARQHITEDGISALKNEESTGMQVQKQKAGAKDHDDPKVDAKAYDTKIGVLAVVTSYLYAGDGARAWKELQEGWGYNDRDRIRQLILRARQNGIIKQLSAPQPGAPSKQTTAQTPASSTPQ
jgi:hypothetical protein